MNLLTAAVHSSSPHRRGWRIDRRLGVNAAVARSAHLVSPRRPFPTKWPTGECRTLTKDWEMVSAKSIKYNTMHSSCSQVVRVNKFEFCKFNGSRWKRRASVGCAGGSFLLRSKVFQFSSTVSSSGCVQYSCWDCVGGGSEEEKELTRVKNFSFFLLFLFFFVKLLSRVNGFMNFMLLLSSCLPLSRWNSNSVAVDTLNSGQRETMWKSWNFPALRRYLISEMWMRATWGTGEDFSELLFSFLYSFFRSIVCKQPTEHTDKSVRVREAH